MLVLALGLAADLGSKAWVFANVADEPIRLDRQTLLANPDFDPIGWRPAKEVLPGGLLDFKLVLNPGAVFGIGAQQRWFFIIFTFAALTAGLIVFGRYTTAKSRFAHIAIGCILAGGLGNLHDRIAFGRVRDFLHMLANYRLPNNWTWPGTNNPELFPWVFNIADMLLLFGMILLMIHLNKQEKRKTIADVTAPEPAPTQG